MPDHHDLWALRALRAIRGRSWDVVISTHGPYACHLVAWRLRSGGRAARWIADFRDLWSDNHIFPGLPPFSFLEQRLERRLCRRADALSTVSEPLAEVLRRRHAVQVQVIENTIDLASFAALDPAPAFPRDGLVRIVYTGTIYRSGQSPQALFLAMERLRSEAPVEFARLRLVFAGKFQHGIRELAAARGLASSIEIMGQVPRETALRMQRDAAALLFLSIDSQAYGGILTAKLFEYLASGTEILSTGYRRDAETAAMIEDSRRGRDYGADADALREALLRIASAEQPKFVDLAAARRIDRAESAARLLRIVESGSDLGRIH
jgi:glycosyltransferase involved in cell wall biosynthesis